MKRGVSFKNHGTGIMMRVVAWEHVDEKFVRVVMEPASELFSTQPPASRSRCEFVVSREYLLPQMPVVGQLVDVSVHHAAPGDFSPRDERPESEK